MTDLLSWMPLEIVRDLGWTLLHFLWQGLVLAALLNAVLPLCRGAVARHNWALGTLALMALAPVATFLFLHDFGGSGGVVFQARDAADVLAPASVFLPRIGWPVVLWLAGVAALSLRALGGWYVAGQLARRDTMAPPADLLQRCQLLQRHLAVSAPVRFLLSRRVNVPVVIGWLRPVILIPVSALAGLPPQQLDALILHELAHIRRLDTVINVMLVAVETILFYHPAVWWVSRNVRIEREHCCDDFAVTACGDAGVYVEALTSLVTWKAFGKAAVPVLAANGGRLRARVARLLEPSKPRRFSLSAMAGLAFLSAIITSVAMAQAQPQATGPKQSVAADGSYASSDKNPVTLRPIRETHTLVPYPTESLRLAEQGTVTLGVRIGADGAVSRLSVTKSSGHKRLDDAAAQYVKSNYRWQPPARNGKPVVATTNVNVVFKLRKPQGNISPVPRPR